MELLTVDQNGKRQTNKGKLHLIQIKINTIEALLMCELCVTPNTDKATFYTFSNELYSLILMIGHFNFLLYSEQHISRNNLACIKCN